MNPDEFCQDTLSKSHSSFSLSFKCLTEQKRHAMTALYALCRTLDDVVDHVSDPGVARIKLEWWRDEIERLYEGTGQHPIVKALKPHVASYQLPKELFHELVDGMLMDLDQNRYDTFKDLSLYCYRVASVVGLLSAQIFGYQHHETQKYAHDLGTCLQMINIIRDVGEDALRDRIYLPQEDLIRFGVYAPDILSLKMTDSLQACLAFQAKRAREFYHKAMTHLATADRWAQLPGIIMANIYMDLLNQIERDDFSTLRHRYSLRKPRKLMIALSTLLKEFRYRKYADKAYNQ